MLRILQSKIWGGTRRSFVHDFLLPWNLTETCSQIPCHKYHDAKLKPSRQDHVYRRMPSQSSNKVPLGKRRTWNVSQAAVRKLRYDILWGKGYAIFNKNSKNLSSRDSVDKRFAEELFSWEDDSKVKDKLSELSNRNLKQLMGKLSQSRNTRERLVHMKLLEGECCQRLKSLSSNDRLYIADLFFMSNVQAARYFELLFSTVDMEWDSGCEMSPEQVLQLLFYIGVYRNSPVQLLENIEDFLCQNLHEFSGRQLGLVCNSYFATNRSIRNTDLLEGISQTVIRDLEGMPLYLVANVLKAFRHSHFNKIDFYEKVGKVLSCSGEALSDNTPSTLSNILSGFASVRIKHDSLFESFGKIIEVKLNAEDRDRMRTKDLCRMLGAFSTLQHVPPPSLIPTLVEALRSLPGLLQIYPEMFVEAMIALGMNRIYPHDLINDVLSPTLVATKKRRLLDQEHQMQFLDTAVGVEQPEYDGNRIVEGSVASALARESHQICAELNLRNGLAAMWQTLRELLEDHANMAKVRCHHIFKFSHIADLEIWLDELNQPLVIPLSKAAGHHSHEHLKLCSSLTRGRLIDDCQPSQSVEQQTSVTEQLFQEAAKDGTELFDRVEPSSVFMKPERNILNILDKNTKRRVVIKVMSWNQYAVNEPVLLGLPQMELRLLVAMGYEVFVINPKRAAALKAMTMEEQHAYIVEHVLRPLNIHLSS